MRSTFATTAATYGLLTLAGIVSFMLPEKLSVPHASAEPAAADVVYLPGTIRDFHKTSADLNVAPSGGNGHYAGNIGQALGANGRPTFVGGGYKVAVEWKDKDANPIAPHLYFDPTLLLLTNAVVYNPAKATLDSYNSTVGPYSATNKGPAPTVKTGSAMPTVSAPTGMPASAGNLTLSGTNNLSGALHYGNFVSNKDTIINITANTTILCDGTFNLGQNTVISVLNGATLRLYVTGQFIVNQTSQINMNTNKPSQCLIYNLGAVQMELNQSTHVTARIVSPNAPIHLAQNDHLYGTFVGKGMQLDQTTGYHQDTSTPQVCGVATADTPGSKGANSTGGIVSAPSFVKWFTDELGTNMSMNYKLELTKNSSTGVYEYLSDEFHPIDNILFGNEGQAHNYYFTFMVDVKFKHKGCAGTFFEFQGADDAWMFVNNQLAIDLGGVIPGTSQHIDMDRLSLVDGQTYNMRFFFAQRNTSVSTFRIRTNLDFIQTPEPYTVTATGD